MILINVKGHGQNIKIQFIKVYHVTYYFFQVTCTVILMHM